MMDWDDLSGMVGYNIVFTCEGSSKRYKGRLAQVNQTHIYVQDVFENVFSIHRMRLNSVHRYTGEADWTDGYRRMMHGKGPAAVVDERLNDYFAGQVILDADEADLCNVHVPDNYDQIQTNYRLLQKRG